MREDLNQTKAGAAYLKILDGVLSEPGFDAELKALAETKDLPRTDPHLHRAVSDCTAAPTPGKLKVSAAHRDEARLKVAEAIHQTRIHPDVHTRFPEPERES